MAENAVDEVAEHILKMAADTVELLGRRSFFLSTELNDVDVPQVIVRARELQPEYRERLLPPVYAAGIRKDNPQSVCFFFGASPMPEPGATEWAEKINTIYQEA